MTRAELAAKLEAKAKACHDRLRALLEELAGLDDDRIVTSDGRNLLDLIRERDVEAQALSLLAARERYAVDKAAENATKLS